MLRLSGPRFLTSPLIFYPSISEGSQEVREDHSLTRSDSDDWGEEVRAMKSMPPFGELYLSIKFILTDHQTSR